MENINSLNGKIYVIRHAQSLYNSAKNDKKLSKIRDSDIRFIDACLSEKGEIQCKENKMHLPNLKQILVSPLRRTLQTAYLLFKDHPDFKDIEVIIYPNIRESFGCACDVPFPVEQVLNDFK